MTQEAQKKINFSLNINTILNSVAAGLILFTLQKASNIEAKLNKLDVESGKHGAAIDELQKSMTLIEEKIYFFSPPPASILPSSSSSKTQ